MAEVGLRPTDTECAPIEVGPGRPPRGRTERDPMAARILFYSTMAVHGRPPYWGGSEKFWYDALMDARFRASFDGRVMLRKSEATRRVASRLRSVGVSVGWCRHPEGPLGGLRRHLGRFRGAVRPRGYAPWYREIERVRPDLVWFHLISINSVNELEYAVGRCQALGIPYWLVLQHAFGHYFLPREDDRGRFEAVVSGASRVVCVSRQNRRVLELAVGRALPNVLMGTNAVTHDFLTRAGLAADEHPVRTQGPARFLCLARQDLEHKGQHRLLEALADRRWLGRDWRLRFVGDGPHIAQVRRLVDYHEIPPGRIEVRGHRDDAIAEVADSDLLVMPSLSEGMPYAMVEAMACGRPAVGTPAGGIPELVEEGRTGWLAGSTEARHLAEALERAWSDRPRWPALGSEARARVASKFDLDLTLPPLMTALRDDAGRVLESPTILRAAGGMR